VSSKQIGQTKGPSTESDFFDFEDAGAVLRVVREGPEVVVRGEVGLAEIPASVLTPVGLSTYFSVSFSLFHSKSRRRIEAASGSIPKIPVMYSMLSFMAFSTSSFESVE